MVDTLGAGSGTFARVTGAFFIGLSLGAWCGACLHPRRPWQAVALAETGVAMACLATLLISTIPTWSTMVSRMPGAQWILPLCLIIPAAFAMGITFPWMITAAGSTGARTVLLYALNTAGAVIGVVLVMTVLLPFQGLSNTAWILIGINGIVAIAAGIFSCISPTNHQDHKNPCTVLPDAGTSPISASALMGLSAGSGFLILSQEVVLQHQFSQILINSLFSSATVLAFVLAILALAAALAPALSRVVGGPARALPWALVLAVIGTCLQPMLLILIRGGVQYLPYKLPLNEYLWNLSGTALLSSGAAIFFAGLVFPLVMQIGGGFARISGRLLAWNGFGGLLGAELTSLVLAPTLGLWQSMVFCACGYLLLLAWLNKNSRFLIVGLSIFTAISAWIAGQLPIALLKPNEKILASRVAPEGVVCVLHHGDDDLRILFNNTYTLGGSKAQTNQERQALLPGLLHGNPRTIATLGVATGSTVAGAAMLPGVTHIDAIELSPTAAAFAKEYFHEVNRGVFEDDRVHLIIGDARHVIAQCQDKYDVIIGDLFLPWRTGEGRMFSREHFEHVRKALRKDGIFCQWLPLFQLTESQYETIVRTFQSVFPEMFLIRGDFYRSHPIIGLVGGRNRENLPWEATSRLANQLRDANVTRDPLVRHSDGIRLMVIGTPNALDIDGPINTLGNAWLEWDAGRNIIGMQHPWFTGQAMQDYLSAINPEAIAPTIPDALKQDMDADWKLWPGR